MEFFKIKMNIQHKIGSFHQGDSVSIRYLLKSNFLIINKSKTTISKLIFWKLDC